jgi:hypothetical protein
MDACLHMHRLAVSMKCAVVQDMVVDELHRIYRRCCEKEIADTFPVPWSYMAELDCTENEAFINLLVDIALHAGILIPDELSEHVVNLVADRFCDSELKLFMDVCTSRKHWCGLYHRHSDEGKPCDYQLAQQVPTSELIRECYDRIGEEAAKTQREQWRAINETRPRDDARAKRQIRRREVVRESLKQEQNAAGLAHKLEILRKKKDYAKVQGGRIKKKDRRARKTLRRSLKRLQQCHAEM